MRISTVKNNAHAQFLRKIAVPDYERFQRVPHQYVGHYYKNGSGICRSRFDMTEPLDFSSACHARAYPGAQPHAPHLAEDRRIGCGVYYIAEALYVKFFCYFLILLYICLKNFY